MHHEETWTTEESLHELRESNKARGEYWQQRTQHPAALQQHDFDAQKDFPLSDGALHANRTQLAALLSMPLDQRRWVTDVAGTPALHCILPLLIELTAARVDLGDDWLPTSEWFDLVGQFMLQAVTEEYLRQGAHGSDTFNTIFAFGCPGVDRWAEEPETVMAMRRLFCDEDNRRQEHADWSHVKRHYINEVRRCISTRCCTNTHVTSSYHKTPQGPSCIVSKERSSFIRTLYLRIVYCRSSSLYMKVSTNQTSSRWRKVESASMGTSSQTRSRER